LPENVFGAKSADSAPASEPAPLTVVDIANITGITPPVAGETPVTAITETEQYTGRVAWRPFGAEFDYGTVYSAIVYLTPKEGYTLDGVPVGFFTVGGAEAINHIGRGNFSAVFPATEPAPEPKPILTTSAEVLPKLHEPGAVVSAAASESTFVLDGAEANLAAYTVADYNWVSLRDLAVLLKATAKVFDVKYDEERERVQLITGRAYDGKKEPYDAGEAEVIASIDEIEMDGQKFAVAAYDINQVKYFRLRDIAILLNFGINYNSEGGGTIALNLDAAYED
jgi:hypothetical protein